ncbi:MAG: ribosomal protein S18-alanine N-acetyltransferase [Micrococcales bacterium]|nr:ribosomal protein S18-alanine N-acetyltransferase [Micrococcales bacterium]
MKIRPATLADIDQLAQLEQVCFGPEAWSKPMLAEEIAGQDRTYVVLEDETGHLCGAAGMAPRQDFAEIMTIEVDPAAQGQGWGRALLSHLLHQVKAAGLDRVLLEVAATNQAAISLYEDFGFTQIGRRKGYYQPSGQDALVMQLITDKP